MAIRSVNVCTVKERPQAFICHEFHFSWFECTSLYLSVVFTSVVRIVYEVGPADRVVEEVEEEQTQFIEIGSSTQRRECD